MALCSYCSGTARCLVCSGTGVQGDGRVCAICGGNGKCTHCSGGVMGRATADSPTRRLIERASTNSRKSNIPRWVMDSIRIVSDEVAENLCSRHEGYFFDRKAAGIDGRGIQRAVVAFANSDGGEVAVGLSEVEQASGRISKWDGAHSPEEYNGLLQAIFDLNPTVPFRYEFVANSVAKGVVLRLFVEKSTEVCKATDNTVYVRVGAQCIPLRDPKRITELAFAKGSRSYEDTPLTDVVAEIVVDSEAMKEFQSEARDAIEPLGFCINEGLISAKDFVPIAAGILLFSDNPPAQFPKRCGIKIAFYDTRLEKPERDHLKETITVAGPLYQQLHRASEAITRILSSITISTAEGFRKVEYPREAIWEILVNAAIHRDYSVADDIQGYSL